MYSPLGFWSAYRANMLEGKNRADARVTLFPNYNRYSSAQSEKAVIEYQKIAEKHGMSLVEMSLGLCKPIAICNQQYYWSNKNESVKRKHQ